MVKNLAPGVALVFGFVGCFQAAEAEEPPRVEKDGTIHVQAFDLPESAFLSAATREALKRQREDDGPEWQAIIEKCGSPYDVTVADMPAHRECAAQAFYKTKMYARLRAKYDVQMSGEKVAGVYTEVFTPTEGIAPKNKNRVLINVHGGGFRQGARTLSHLESVPIAALGKIKVVSVDYRQGPEYTFPAASEDVGAVYAELLKSYKPENIGIYGCSAGGWLTAQSLAWFQHKGLPTPAAAAMLCAASPAPPEIEWNSDSALIGGALFNRNYGETYGHDHPYYKGVDRRNPLVSPILSDEVMSKFPPSLLATGTRDWLLSSVVMTHRKLVQQGVEADLQLWEGLGHGFFFAFDMPEALEVNELLIRFFDKHLGQ